IEDRDEAGGRGRAEVRRVAAEPQAARALEAGDVLRLAEGGLHLSAPSRRWTPRAAVPCRRAGARRSRGTSRGPGRRARRPLAPPPAAGRTPRPGSRGRARARPAGTRALAGPIRPRS